MIGKPIVLSSAISFSSAISSIGAASDPANLRAPSGEAMLVDDIQLWVKGQGTAAGVWHEWEINAGRAKLTDSFIPAALCVRNEDSIRQKPTSGQQVFLWSFARPLYIPVGQTLQVKVRAGIASSKAYVSFRGRVLPDNYPEPATVQVPYAAIFRPGIVTQSLDESDVTKYIYKSNSSDLSNPFASKLNVNRFVMGVSGRTALATGVATDADIDPCTLLYYTTQYRNFPKVQLFTQNGAPIVRDAMTLAQFCSLIRGEWAVQYALNPNESIFAVVDQAHAVLTDTNATQVGIGMVGWREVPLSEVK